MRHCFRIIAFPDPQALPRVIGIFAQRSLIPATMASRLLGDMLHVEAALDDLDAPTAAIITAKLCEGVLIATARCDLAQDANDRGSAPTPTIVTAA